METVYLEHTSSLSAQLKQSKADLSVVRKQDRSEEWSGKCKRGDAWKWDRHYSEHVRCSGEGLGPWGTLVGYGAKLHTP